MSVLKEKKRQNHTKNTVLLHIHVGVVLLVLGERTQIAILKV